MPTEELLPPTPPPDAETHVAGPDPPRRVPGVDPGRARARPAEPGRVGPRRRRHLRGVPRRPLRGQRDLPHRQLGAARAGTAAAHGPRDDLRAHRRLVHADHAARAATGLGHLAARHRVDGRGRRRDPGAGAVRCPPPGRWLPLHRDGMDRGDRPPRRRHVARHHRSSRSCSPAACSTRSARSGCGCSGRTPVRWCSDTTRCGTR